MAYANWLLPSKTSGSGNDTVDVTAVSNNTGRSPRQTQIAFKAANVADVVRKVIQAGKPEFVTILSAAAVSKDGVTVLTIEGVSNSSKLTFALASGGSLPLTLPASYLAPSLGRTEEDYTMASGVCSVSTVVSLFIFCIIAAFVA